MQEMRTNHEKLQDVESGFRSRTWKVSYRGSSINEDEKPDSILHDFYIPALQLAVKYDRVAGYFRASSLAAASQGFSSFVGRKGKMRLIVGADLEPEDVKAILEGDKQRLAKELNDEISREEEWPADVHRGVTLLAWMVANDYLEVRVALRVHAKTGEPIPFDSDADGYFHEKWFVMTDAEGNRIHGAGSLNESRTALLHNSENLSLHFDWHGEMYSEDIDRAERDFERMWRGEVPHLAVMKLPDAVRQRLIKIGEGVTVPQEIDGTRPALAIGLEPSIMERLRFAVLRDAPHMPGGRWVGLSTAPVDPWPHQEVVVRRLVETWPYSYLLCDEVGLGKTIEAGLAFRCLYLSGIVKRILIAAPASLTEQWLRQMASKVLLPFGKATASPEIRHDYLLPNPKQVSSSSLFAPNLVILSTGLLARKERAKALEFAEPFDIVLVDEAHAARRSNATQGTEAHPEYVELYKNIRDFVRPSTRSLWLATATPMQLHPVEVCDLIALTNRVGPFQYSPRLTLDYYDRLSALVKGETLSESDWTFLRYSVRSAKEYDLFLWEYLHRGIIPRTFQRILEDWMERGRIPRGRDMDMLRRVLFSVAPLSRVMMRHNRQLLEIYREKGQLHQNLARRHILPIEAIQFTDREREIYNRLDEYCNGLNKQIAAGANARSRNMIQFYLSFLRLRFASSLFAIKKTLERRLIRVEATLAHQYGGAHKQREHEEYLDLYSWENDDSEDDIDVDTLLKDRRPEDLEWERKQLQDLLNNLAQINERPSKINRLLKILDRRKVNGRIKQTVIFTRFYDTLLDIVHHLRTGNPTMRIGTYSGRGAEFYDVQLGTMREIDREEVKALFLRGDIDVLVCTDAAAEGLNLQTADMLINFDLGWNPMKIEQRIGRIDRIGQRYRDIFVVNFCYVGSAEETVYGRLLERIEQARLVVGTQQLSLLPVTPDDFRRLAERTISKAELEAQVMERVREQQEHARSMELPAKDLYEIYTRMTRDGQPQQAPIDRLAIWQALTESSYLRELGCQVTDEENKVFVVNGVPGVPDGTRFTISPELYDTGIAGWEGRLHFASYGDPYFDRLLEHMTEFEFPPCIRRIEATLGSDYQLKMVAYIVACRRSGGEIEVKLIRSWHDLEGISIAEEITIDERAVEEKTSLLRRMAKEEFQVHLGAERIEKINTESAKLQRLLELYVIKDLLEVCGTRLGDGASSNAVFREVDTLLETRPAIQVSIPTEPFRGQNLLFDLRMFALVDRVTIPAPDILVRAGLDAAKALVDSMKTRGRSVPLKSLLNMLNREINDLKKNLRATG